MGGREMPHPPGMIVQCSLSNWALKHLLHLHSSVLQDYNKATSFAYKKRITQLAVIGLEGSRSRIGSPHPCHSCDLLTTYHGGRAQKGKTIISGTDTVREITNRALGSLPRTRPQHLKTSHFPAHSPCSIH